MSADKRNFQLNRDKPCFGRIKADEDHLDPISEHINVQNAVVLLFALNIFSSLQPVTRMKPQHTSSAL